MLLSLAAYSCSRVGTRDVRQVLCPLSIVLKLFLTCSFVVKSMNYLVSALAVRPVSPQKPKDVQENCETEVDDAATVEETDGQEDGEVPEKLEEQEEMLTSPTIVKRQRKDSRTKTRLHFCHPPPSTRQKRLRTRPKILLQLQKKSRASRPVPTYDVLSTTALTSRFAQELPHTFTSKSVVGVEELAVVKSEDYSNQDTHTDDFNDVLHDDIGTREVVATISHHGAGEPGIVCRADICLNKARTWAGTPIVRGGYEFVAVEKTGHRLVARWVPRKRPQAQCNGQRSSSPIREPAGKAFNFSLLDPSSRRHAVIATFDAQGLEILDRYSSPKSGTKNRLSISTLDTASMVNDGDSKDVDEGLRSLIVATSVWVSYCEGFIGSLHTHIESPRAKTTDRTHRRKSLSVDLKDLREDRTSLERASSVQGLTSPTFPATTPLTTPPPSIAPRRTQSTNSPILIQPTRRPLLSRRAETMYPIFDAEAEVSTLGSRTSLEDEAGDLGVQGKKDQPLPAAKEKSEKRAKSISKLCCSLKRMERSSSSS